MKIEKKKKKKRLSNIAEPNTGNIEEEQRTPEYSLEQKRSERRVSFQRMPEESAKKEKGVRKQNGTKMPWQQVEVDKNEKKHESDCMKVNQASSFLCHL